LRWIRALTDNGLFLRQADPADGRRVFIALSEKAADAMTNFFTAAKRGGKAMLV
jgi:DNA-binding MarR family transcriptional regulator